MTSPRTNPRSHPRPKVHLTEEKETLLATLYGRALDSRAKRPILGDTLAADTMQRLDYDFSRMRLSPGNAAAVALRARQLDVWTAGFLARHEEATVVHLGCGLDSRVHRLDPGPGVRWFDVDYPEVIALRRQLYPERAGYTTVPSSVTDPAWVAQIPPDRPTVIVAEGLLMYLTEEDGTALLRRLMDRVPSGELAFDAFSRFAIRVQWLNRVVVKAGARLHWGTDTAGIAALSPELETVESISALELPGIEKLSAGSRLAARMSAKLPAVRDMARMYRCRF
ncbi:class I SAM-dependent methyltransferase [Streptomyces sp. Isolate_219]|uniref:class I SAM-dependent methyltransferase n=1 Tax=Streptomyces sp. Isolate_219 TaxID=2950110 RepID=UPI0021C865F9|nr:class I SAM-dependent methyltransferase [Streptomyces sp. Isolate_219]MCR8573133.1 class I SAM-dependent methyltransferase [Streptomyces sp. Isolate_219]